MPSQSRTDASWFRSVLDRYEGALVRYAARITGDVETARDVVQDTFLRLIRQERASVNGHLAEWLFTVCRNRALDVKRKQRRVTTLGERQPDQVPEPGPATAGVTDEVLGVLETLPERQQDVIRLKFQSGLSYKEISRVTKLSVSNVGVLIHLGIKSIREELRARREPRANANANVGR